MSEAARFFVFFNDTATTEIYTLSLHDALPICDGHLQEVGGHPVERRRLHLEPPRLRAPGDPERAGHPRQGRAGQRSEEHTSELQSRQYLVCRLLLEKKKQRQRYGTPRTQKTLR